MPPEVDAPRQAKRRQAAELVALGEKSFSAIAKAVGVDRSTLYEWRREPAFQAAVERHCRRIAGELIPVALARLRRNIEKGADNHANRAIELALRAAGWLNPQTGGDVPNAGTPEPAAPAAPSGPEPVDYRAMDAAELARLYHQKARAPGPGDL